MSLSLIYSLVKSRAPTLVAGNPHWQDKVRQVLQRLRGRKLAVNPSKGTWEAAVESKHSRGEAA